MADFHDLEVYKRACELAVRIHNFRFNNQRAPKLASQVKRSSAAIAANIAEGYDLPPLEFASRIRVSIGESRESQHHLEFGMRINAIIEGDAEWATGELIEIRKMLYGLHKYLKRKAQRERDNI